MYLMYRRIIPYSIPISHEFIEILNFLHRNDIHFPYNTGIDCRDEDCFGESMKLAAYLSEYLVPLVIFYIVGFAALQKRPIFDDFIEGARQGMRTVAGILPTLVGLMTAVGVLRASGFLDFLAGVLEGPASLLRIPAEVVPVILVRLVSSSAATGLLLDIFKVSGPDSAVGMMVSILESCTETVFYTMSVYFMTVKVTKTRWTLAGAMAATGAGVAASIVLALL